jgi:hypothetical protein
VSIINTMRPAPHRRRASIDYPHIDSAPRRRGTILHDVGWMLIEALAFVGGMAGLLTIVIIAAAFAGR